MPDWLYTTVPLLCATAYAVAWRQRLELRFYFVAQLLAEIVLEVAHRFWLPYTSTTYGALYAGMTALILLASQLYVWDQLEVVRGEVRARRVWALAAVFASGPVAIAYFDLAKPLRYYNWVYLAEAFVLVFQASALAQICKNLFGVYRRVSLVFVMLWLALAGFRLGFNLHLPDVSWVRLNDLVPYAIVVVGFLTIGEILHRYERSLRWTTPARRGS